MAQSTAPIPIHGGSLTCFTSAVATYLSRYRIDYTFAFGLQLYFATKLQEQDGLKGSFIYFHHPLTSDSPLYAFHPTRCQTDNRAMAYKRILEEMQNQKHIIIAGDAYNLPWHINYNRKHVIHWFVIEEINEAQQKVRICDPFELVDIHGTQVPFDGWVPLPSLVDLAKVFSNPPQPYLSRDLHAFGTEEHFPMEDYRGYQWFEAVTEVKQQNIPRTYLLQELVDTHLHMTGAAQREDLVHDGWLLGLEAVANLPVLFRKHLTKPDLYEMRDDIWGAGRHRQIFAHALRRTARDTGQLRLEALANWCDETLVPLWASIPRIMLYNASCLAHQRPPKDMLIQQAERVYQAELECMQKLEDHLSHIGGGHGARGSLDHQTITSGRFVSQHISLDSDARINETGDKTADALDGISTCSGQADVSPCNYIEEAILDIWVTTLRLEKIGIHDDFFKIGGDSLKAMRVLSQLSQTFQVEVPLLTFLEESTIAELAMFVNEYLPAN